MDGKPKGMITLHILHGRSQMFQRLRWLHWHPELCSDPHVRAGPLATRENLALCYVLRTRTGSTTSKQAQPAVEAHNDDSSLSQEQSLRMESGRAADAARRKTYQVQDP